MTCAWQVEIDEYATRVLAKHWPDVPRFRDVRECGKHNLESVDLICGGFPCQDISHANPTGKGLDGKRSGLWSEYFRIICELRPRYVLVENVAALLARGIDRVLSDLASRGYNAEWSVLSASCVGAPQLRERLFILAYPNALRREEVFSKTFSFDQARAWHEWQQVELCRTRGGTLRPLPIGRTHRMGDGVSEELQRIAVIGNAVVPQVAEWIGNRIMQHSSNNVSEGASTRTVENRS